jgi:hypothetical protein
MLWVPQKGQLRVETNAGAVGTANIGTAVTTGAAAGTKGAVAQLIASTLFDAYWIMVMASNLNSSATASEGALDIMVGAATEELLIPNMLMGYAGGAGSPIGGPQVWQFPLYIPAGSRLSAKACSARTSTAFRVAVWLYGGDGVPPFRVGSKVTTYGVTVPNGTTITPGASGAEGAWTQIAATSSEDHFAFYPSFQPQADTTINNLYYNVDIGVGAATEEQIGSWFFQTNSNESMGGPFNPMPAFQDVSSGTRLAMRASCSGVLDGGYGAALHGIS